MPRRRRTLRRDFYVQGGGGDFDRPVQPIQRKKEKSARFPGGLHHPEILHGVPSGMNRKILIASLAVIALLIWINPSFLADPHPVLVKVEKGAPASEIVRSLGEKGVVQSPA